MIKHTEPQMRVTACPLKNWSGKLPSKVLGPVTCRRNHLHRTRKSLQGFTGYTSLMTSSCPKGVTTSTARPTKSSSRDMVKARSLLQYNSSCQTAKRLKEG